MHKSASCYYALRNIEKAGELLNNIIANGFYHWSIYSLMFDIDKANNDQEKALIHLSCCALADDTHKMRVKFYDDAAEYLYSIQMERNAMLHRRLSMLIREEEGWRVRENAHSWQISDEIMALDKNAILKELNMFWWEQRDKEREYTAGRISKILPSGNDGFISAEDGNRYYFRMKDVERGRSKLIEGSSVKFTLMDKMNVKRNIMEKNAVTISLVQ